MTRLAVNELTTYRWSLEEDVQNFAAAGFSAIGVWRQKLSDCGEDKGAELIRDSGLRVSSLLWAGGFTGSDGRTHQESIEDALEAVRTAAELQAGCLLVHTGARAGHTHNHARRLVKSALAEVASLAEESGVTLALEPMHPGCAGDWTFITDLDQALELLSDVSSPALRLALDTYHLCQDGLAPQATDAVDRIALVQLGDARQPPDGEQNRCSLGAGKIPLGEIVAGLLAAGYLGDWEIELLGEDIESTDYRDLLAQSRRTAAQWFGAARKIA
jgi:sugar phosphate isomerase/epimerase